MRRDLLPYFGLPFYRAMIERSGFGADIEAYDAAAGDLEAMQRAISDGFLDELDSGRRRSREVRGGIERYAAAGRDLAVHRPDPGKRLRGHPASGHRMPSRA